ncbi:MAG TPA: serine/threonine-protein kinase [Kofleriaceae bacterium]|nr:serine/threonine-protein kinase [Kofleriaceae bacterium]
MKLCPKCQKQFTDDANFCPVDAARLVPLETQAAAADALSAKFELGDALGGHRTGAVHRAIDKATGQAAAVKVIAPAVLALPGVAQRLERELKQLERVQSAGVAKVLASGKRGDDSWVALELIDGAQTLAEAIAVRGPIALDQAAHLVEVIGEALIEAAQVGVVHRDLAPKNVLFAGADVKLINFSLPVPTSDKVAGVAGFVAPEQHDGKPVDQRSNLYSLGALYYYVLTGQTVEPDAAGTIRMPSALAAVPAAVEAVIMRALDKSPTKRFLTVRQFVDEVGRVAREGAEGGADLKSTQPVGRAGKPKAELVQTLLGMRLNAPVIPSTVIGIVAPSAGAAGHAPMVAATVSAGVAPAPGPVGPAQLGPAMPAPLPPQMLSPDRSPWAPPSTAPPAPTLSPEAGAAAPAMPAPPVLAPPVIVSPMMGAPAGKKGRGNEDPRSQFRDTLWFKKGELDAQAAQTAAEERAVGNDLAHDKSDMLPIDERYKDDGTVSRTDKEKYSLRTGATAGHMAMRDPSVSASMSGKVSEDALIDEMKGGRNLVFVIIGIGVIIVALIIILLIK